jgi:hypothetical protein
VGFVADKVALGQVFSEYFGFPCQPSFHQILHPYNHPGKVQYANWWPTCRVDPVGLQPPLFELKKIEMSQESGLKKYYLFLYILYVDGMLQQHTFLRVFCCRFISTGMAFQLLAL